MTKEELEKEAEEKYCNGCKLRIEQCLWAWRNTNGLNEPNEKNCSCIKVPAYIAGAEFGYNKANEWHYVKDGDLPPLRKEVLWCVDEQLWLGELLETRIDFGEWELDSVLFNDYEIAWKEIVLPKESE